MDIKKRKCDIHKKFLAMGQNSEEQQQNKVVIQDDVYQNEVNKLLENKVKKLISIKDQIND